MAFIEAWLGKRALSKNFLKIWQYDLGLQNGTISFGLMRSSGGLHV